MRLWKLPDQVVRLLIAFAIIGIGFAVARQRFVPKTFGELGHYSAAAIDTAAARQIHYAGLQACVECHDDVGAIKAKSFHRNLTCEVCHGAAADHAEDPGVRFPAIPRSRQACLYCHDYLSSRPTGFPQIIERSHNPLKPCMSCHNPHDPKPPQVPGSCAACHGEIARTKSISRHAELECETCHQAAPGHRENPRAFLPTKPTTREFCGECHAKGATGLEMAPRVDMATHGDRYLCWQCHYPHHPEGR